MSTSKKIGIWMDHASAHIMEITTAPMETNIITSKFTHEEKEDSLVKSERLMHNKEQHEEKGYYKQLAEIIVNCSHVLLFGPTDAKVELLNILKADHRFADIKIEVKQADKMTDKQQQAFTEDYFSKN